MEPILSNNYVEVETLVMLVMVVYQYVAHERIDWLLTQGHPQGRQTQKAGMWLCHEHRTLRLFETWRGR